MTIQHIKGDLFAADERAIAHGCNCHGVMGAGVAAIVREQFPNAYDVYRIETFAGRFYPGVAQPVECGRATPYSIHNGDRITVYNLATQNAPGANARLDYVRAAMENMKRCMDYVGNRRIAMPKIGAGIGGLTWSWVEAIIDEVFNSDDYDVRIYSL